MLAAIRSAAVFGIEAYDVTVEVDLARGLPAWNIVGLPAKAVKESRERVSAALVNAGFEIPPKRITVNLAPADTPKAGTAFDLPIALGVLVAAGWLSQECVAPHVFIGELGLDASIRPIRGALSVARRLAAMPECTATLVLPSPNVREASLARDVPLSAPATLIELVEWLGAGVPLPRADDGCCPPSDDEHLDFADVAGQDAAKRALTIAAAGFHGVLMVGPPGAGKTMLARRLPGILPSMSHAEALEVTAVHSVAGTLDPTTGIIAQRPFRAPHHSVSTAGLVGGGSQPRPGEVSLAHHGVLFLDELLEFPRAVLESLRQPMEDGFVSIARASAALRFPARFALAAAMNPCPCGHAGDPSRPCICAAAEVLKYRSRLSGPLADRIDIHVHVPPLSLQALSAPAVGTSSPQIRQQVERARDLQRERYGNAAASNARAPGRWLEAHGGLHQAARQMLAAAGERLQLSARGYHRVLRVARTIADLEAEPWVTERHVGEALALRQRSHDRPSGINRHLEPLLHVAENLEMS